MDKYRCFNANFWKYNPFFQYNGCCLVLFPIGTIEMLLDDKTAPEIKLKLAFLHWELGLSYQEDAPPTFRVNENDWE